jgi:hypothetical protein
MSGITPLIDTLLATRLAQRVDLLPLKGALEITDPDAVASVEKVTNDIRLPSRAARQQSLGLLLADSAGSSKGSTPSPSARSDGSVTLSAVARALSAILELPSSPEAKILGAKPLWPHSEPPAGPVLTAALARTVATSGLFYESHLQQFAAGTLTLAQLTQEPQAQLEVMSKISPELPGARVASPNQGQGGAASAVEVPGAPAAVSARPEVAAALPAALPISSSQAEAASQQDLAGQASTAKKADASAPDALRSNAPAPAGIHPDAMALVRQQLELLAVPVFRWGGEAWPGTRMDWEIHQEPGDRPAGAESQALLPTWSTRLTIDLPTLRAVEVRLSLAGNQLQLHLSASENTTRALLGEGRQELPKRLSALGLQLSAWQIGALPQAPAAPAGRKDDDDAA